MSDIKFRYRIREVTGQFLSQFYIERAYVEGSSIPYGNYWKQMPETFTSLAAAKMQIDEWEFKPRTIYHSYP